MGRLIDADHVKDFFFSETSGTEDVIRDLMNTHGLDYANDINEEVIMAFAKDLLKAVQNVIDTEPTAYDPDKVVEQLEDMKSTYRRLRDLKDKDYLKYGYIIETLIDAIEIVKDDGGDEMIEKSMPATKNVPKERDTMSCKKAERYGYVKAICETDKGLFNRKVEEWINLTDGVILDASCGIIDGKTVFQAVIGGLRK